MNRKDQELERLSEYSCLEHDVSKTTGVLLSDEIEYYAKKYKLIDPFNPQNLKPASYKLTVGDEYSCGGIIKKLHDETGKDQIIIPSFEVAIIKTEETINLPRFLIARWNVRVKWAYAGLIWVGGPQVDPGWVGHLFCPIYNLSNEEVLIRKGDSIAVIDFVKTTPFENSKCVSYVRPPENIVIENYKPEKLKSGLYTQAKERIDDVEKRVNKFGSRLDLSIGFIFASIAILVAALTIFVSSNVPRDVTPDPRWIYMSIVFSMFALFISLLAVTHTKTEHSLVDHIEKIPRIFENHGTIVGIVLTFIILILIVLLILVYNRIIP